MKITFITPTPPDISAFGVRALSAYLKRAGHSVNCIFLPGGIEKLRHGGGFRYSYPDRTLADIIDIAGDSQVVGISFMSQYRDRAIQLTTAIRSATKATVIWGGIHAEVNPADALAHADACTLCESEYILETFIGRLESGASFDDIPGLVTGPDIPVPGTEALPIIDDLDALPFIDMDLDNQYVLEPRENRVLPMTAELLKMILPLMPGPGRRPVRVYRTMTSRGCPHHCTYCANRIKADKYVSKKYLRFRSPDHVMAELLEVVEKYPFIEGVHFFDDVFTAMPSRDLETLCRRFQKEIGLPYYAQASPSILSDKQMELFMDTGLVFMEIGVQTGSERIRRMYKRPESNERILEAAHRIHRHRERLLTPHYHVILDNPWETRDDVRATLDLLTRIPGRFMLCLASLTFYPGTDLYYRAREEGLIRDEERDIYRKPFYIPRGRYLNYLIYLADIHWIPRWLLRWLGGAPARVFDREIFGGFFDLARRVTDKLRLAGKGFDAVFHGEFHRISRYFRRVR